MFPARYRAQKSGMLVKRDASIACDADDDNGGVRSGTITGVISAISYHNMMQRRCNREAPIALSRTLLLLEPPVATCPTTSGDR